MFHYQTLRSKIFLFLFVFLSGFLANNVKAKTTIPVGDNVNLKTSEINTDETTVNFNGSGIIEGKLIVDTDKTLSSITSGKSTSEIGRGDIEFVNKSKLSIDASIGTESKLVRNILFNADGILEIKTYLFAEKVIPAVNESGTIILNHSRVQNVSVQIGSDNNRLKLLNSANSGGTGIRIFKDVFVKDVLSSSIISIDTDKNLDMSGNFNVSNLGALKGLTNNSGNLTLSGNQLQIIDTPIGASEKDRFGKIIINNRSINGVNFTKDIFAADFALNGNSASFSGSQINIVNGILTNQNGSGEVIFGGNINQNVNSAIGSFNNHLLAINNLNSGSTTFNQDLFTENFYIGGKTIIAGNSQNFLGNVDIANNQELILSANNTNINSLNNEGTVSIKSGSNLNILQNTLIFGTLNIGVNYDANKVPLFGKISAKNNLEILDETKIHFDFASSDVKIDNKEYLFLSVDQNKNLTVNLEAITISDNSALMKVGIKKTADQKGLVAYNIIDDAALNQLGDQNSKKINSIMNISSNGKMKMVQNSLMQISDLDNLSKSVNYLKTPAGGNLGFTSININNRIDNVINSRIFALNSNGNSGFSTGNNPGKYGVWGQFFSGESSQKSTSDQSGYDSNVSGIVFGFDKLIENTNFDNIFGLALTYAKADTDNNLGSKNDINSYQLALYNNNSKNNHAGFYNENILSFAYNQYKTSRNIQIGSFNSTAKGDFAGHQYAAKTVIGYNFKLSETITLAPYSGIKYSHLKQSDYQEDGADDVGLIIQNKPFDNLAADLGSAITAFDHLDERYNANYKLNLGLTRNLNTKGQKSTSSFIAGGDQTSNTGIALPKNIFNLGGEINLIDKKQDCNLAFRYDLQSGSGFKSNIFYIKYHQNF